MALFVELCKASHWNSRVSRYESKANLQCSLVLCPLTWMPVFYSISLSSVVRLFLVLHLRTRN